MAHLPPKLSRGCKAGEETTQEKHFSYKTSSSCCAGKRREREMWWQEQEIEIQCGAHSEQCPVMDDIHELTASLELGVCLAGRCITECFNKKKKKKESFFMPSILAEVWKSGGILCCKYLCSSSLCSPWLGELLGDGRGPTVTAAFLLLAMTVAQQWWLACCREEGCTPSRLDLQRVNWSKKRLNLSLVQWQK